MRVAVVGAGSWGTALAILLGRKGHDTFLYGRASEHLDQLASRRENLRYLPGFLMPETVEVRPLADPLSTYDLCVIAVPAAALQATLPQLREQHSLCLASKGLAPQVDALLSELVTKALPEAEIAALSGPNLAIELAREVPTAAVAACPREDLAEKVREAFMGPHYRVYISDDLRGVELAGALKNVMALGAGISDGLGFGDNTKGALLARGLNEITRLGLAMGARLDTFLGIAGVGDLIATASSDLSRNYRVGRAIGRGGSLEAALEEIGQVAEGVETCHSAVQLAHRLKVDAPLTGTISQMLTGDVDPRRAVSALMERTPKREGVLCDR
ncbi:MAG: NAD(P)H-dependent glycerol-3-phosphate dehydrogenase [Fimbriimonadaceae bacterium]